MSFRVKDSFEAVLDLFDFKKNTAETLQKLLHEQLGGKNPTLRQLGALANSPLYSHVDDQIRVPISKIHVKGSFQGKIKTTRGKTSNREGRELNKEILTLLRNKPGLTMNKIWEQVEPSCSRPAFSQRLSSIQSNGFIKKTGSRQHSRWYVTGRVSSR